jgi:hypothetical protein
MPSWFGLVCVLQVVAGANQKIQDLAATSADKGPSQLLELSANVAKVAAVSQDDMASSIGGIGSKLAESYTADATAFDPSTAMSEFESVSDHILTWEVWWKLI